IEKGAVYYVTSVTYKRKDVFSDVSSARFLLITIAYHRYILDFKLFGYVVMPDHFHILVQPSERYDLPKIMKHIKGNFARKYNEWHIQKPSSAELNNNIPKLGSRRLNADYKKDSRGYYYLPVWQEGYYETVMRDEKDVINRLNYMHNNPVRKGLVKNPDEYEFSSYHQY
ncbi:MAG: transposase, partial [candidate division WOR-3 bacterium]|nr:transposase [candidate division WOR-3 bacterium]